MKICLKLEEKRLKTDENCIILYNISPTGENCITLYIFLPLGGNCITLYIFLLLVNRKMYNIIQFSPVVGILYNIIQFFTVFTCFLSNFRQIFNNFPAVFKSLKAAYFLKWLPKKYHLYSTIIIKLKPTPIH